MKAFLASLAACAVLALAGAGALAWSGDCWQQERRTVDGVRL